jgi:hypothetical protein
LVLAAATIAIEVSEGQTSPRLAGDH